MNIASRLTKSQKRRLSSYECGLCELRIDQTLSGLCAAYIGKQCTMDEINRRAIACLRASKKPEIADTSKLTA